MKKVIVWVDEDIKNILKKEAQRTNSDMNKVITLLVNTNLNKVVQENSDITNTKDVIKCI